MSSNMKILTATTSNTLLNKANSVESNFSQSSTVVASQQHSPASKVVDISIDDELPDFKYEVFYTRDSLEIARNNLSSAELQRAGLREFFPFGRDSLELARENFARNEWQQREKRTATKQRYERNPGLDEAQALTFLHHLGSLNPTGREDSVFDDGASILDHKLEHRDSLEPVREQSAVVCARRNAQKPAQRLITKAKAIPGNFKASVSKLAGKSAQLTPEVDSGVREPSIEVKSAAKVQFGC